MANKRNIKKDIDYLVYEVISDCYTFKHLFPDSDHKGADKIIDEAIDMRTDLIMRVNHPDGKDNKKLVKEHFKKVHDDLLKKADNFFERLNKMLAETQDPKSKPAATPETKTKAKPVVKEAKTKTTAKAKKDAKTDEKEAKPEGGQEKTEK